MLDGVSFDTLVIDEIPFFIPSRLRRFERKIPARLKRMVAKLKNIGWHDYVLMSGIVMVVVPSPTSGNFGILANRRVYFMDSGQVVSSSITWSASNIVHEATHIFQEEYLPFEKRNDRRTKERDACREQIRFLRRTRGKRLIEHIRKELKGPRCWWEYLETGPKTRVERYWQKRLDICRRIHTDLVPHISF